jgi:ribonuclease P protein component
MRAYVSLRGRRDFALVLRRGRAIASKDLTILAFSPPRELALAFKCARVGIIITKKVGNAVQRNRLRRQCKAILDQSRIGQTRLWYVVQFKPKAATLDYASLHDQLTSALLGNGRPAGAKRGGREETSR